MQNICVYPLLYPFYLYQFRVLHIYFMILRDETILSNFQSNAEVSEIQWISVSNLKNNLKAHPEAYTYDLNQIVNHELVEEIERMQNWIDN